MKSTFIGYFKQKPCHLKQHTFDEKTFFSLRQWHFLDEFTLYRVTVETLYKGKVVRNP